MSLSFYLYQPGCVHLVPGILLQEGPMPMEIRQLAALDMTSDERVTYHATEWVAQEGEPQVDVWSQASAADRQANTVVQGGALAVARYATIAHFNTDLCDAEDFARDNLRLHSAMA